MEQQPSLSSLVMRLGAILALPLVVSVPIAVFIDRTYGTLPIATISSLVISACVSTVFVVRLVGK